ncbi:hypothetical protein [Methylobacterium nodulans]|uniref:Transposase n=1 Tax=Methylobacterium nodulans (strain LMG 21967 / CNCM I-2342 / ORS 2060) TaxID=460265 RepID=B8IXM9_METNO|nr:hypothetical protein [Methylobacterium nodulans]ACL62861.1 hypothetical protein Mnod_7832 [Methylobacterium nodulans ORS 2060]
MQLVSSARHQFPAEIVQHAVWLYLRFTLSYPVQNTFYAQRHLISRRTLRLFRAGAADAWQAATAAA